MTSTKVLLLLRRAALVTTRQRGYHATALPQGGATPSLPPFARSPVRAEPLTENTDALWDDGVAAELALDFDAPHISSREGLYSWMAGLSTFALLYQGIKAWTGGALSDNPALSHATDCVDKDHSQH